MAGACPANCSVAKVERRPGIKRLMRRMTAWEKHTNLYSQVYDRDSLDGLGLPLAATVHYKKDYDNAFWDGNQMIFGDGDGDLFNRFTISVDVMGHELTHGVTQYESNLVYRRQSGLWTKKVFRTYLVLS